MEKREMARRATAYLTEKLRQKLGMPRLQVMRIEPDPFKQGGMVWVETAEYCDDEMSASRDLPARLIPTRWRRGISVFNQGVLDDIVANWPMD